MSDIDLTEAMELAWDESFSERTVVVYKDSATDTGLWELVDSAVKIAAPLIEAQVRAQVAAEIEATMRRRPPIGATAADAWTNATERTARIARGDS